jgi:hypothetical protein
MADEATITAMLNISREVGSENISFQNLGPGSFNADVTGPGGPSPGTVMASATGSQINLKAQLTNPSLYVMYNVGQYPVDVGIYDVGRGYAYFFSRLYPGEQYVGRFSPFMFGETGPGTAGTGTIGPDDNVLIVRGVGATGYLNISAFDF